MLPTQHCTEAALSHSRMCTYKSQTGAAGISWTSHHQPRTSRRRYIRLDTGMTANVCCLSILNIAALRTTVWALKVTLGEMLSCTAEQLAPVLLSNWLHPSPMN